MSRDERSAPPPLELLLVPGLDGTGLLFASFLAALPRTIAPSVIPYPPGAVLDAPHLVLQTRPAEAAGILADFLRV